MSRKCEVDRVGHSVVSLNVQFAEVVVKLSTISYA